MPVLQKRQALFLWRGKVNLRFLWEFGAGSWTKYCTDFRQKLGNELPT